MTNLELSTARNKAFDNIFTINDYDYFRKLTQFDTKVIAEYNVTVDDKTRENSNLLLKTSTYKISHHAKSSNEDLNERKSVTDNMKQIKLKHIEKEKQNMQNIGDSEYSAEDNEMSASGLNSAAHITSGARRIFHGHKTKVKHFPFLVTVHVLGRFICSGSIIRSNLVITAASCLKRWQEWKQHLANKKNNIHAVENPENSTEYIPTDVNTDLTTTDVTMTTTDVTMTTADVMTINIAPETIEDDTDTPVTETGETNTPKDDDIIITTDMVADDTETTPERRTTETVETTTDWTTTTPEVTTETTQETSTAVWSETPPPELGELAVRIGTNYYRLGGKVVHVVKVYFHPQYVYKTLRNNLAILRLERHVNVTRRRVQVVDFIRVKEDVPEGTEVTIAGWGAKTYHNKVYNALWNLIHKAVLTVSSQLKCRKRYSKTYVQSTNFCALSEHNEGACNRDGGNPAMVGKLLVGVISFGSPKCGAPDAPTVFTNLGYYAQWIEEIIEIVEMEDTSIETSHELSEEGEFTTLPTETELVSVAANITETKEEEKEGVVSSAPAVDSAKRYLKKYEYHPRSYRRSQDQSELKSNALPIGIQETKEMKKDFSKYDIGPILTETPEKFGTSLRPPDLSVSEEVDKNNIVLTHFTKASYGTLNRPDIDYIYRPTQSMIELYDFTPYQGKNHDTFFYGKDSTVTDRYLTTALTKENNHFPHRDDYEDDKFEDIRTSDNRLHDSKDYDVTHPYKYQIEAPPQTSFREIKDEMEKIIGQLDLSAFGSDMTAKWQDLASISKIKKSVSRNYNANK